MKPIIKTNNSSTSSIKQQRKSLLEFPSKVILLQTKCTEIRQKDRKEYEKQLFLSINRQRVFKYINSRQRERFHSNMMNRTTNEAATTDIGKEERFNSYLVTFSVTDPHFLAGILGVVGRQVDLQRKEETPYQPLSQ